MRRILFFSVLWFGGCLGDLSCNFPVPGGDCNPRKTSSNACPAGYYCALTETCTRACTADSDCDVRCDGGIGCGNGLGAACLDGFCQANCARIGDGGCDYDPYGRSVHHAKK